MSHATRTETLTVYLFFAFSCRLQSSLELSNYRDGNVEAFDIRWHIKRSKGIAEYR